MNSASNFGRATIQRDNRDEKAEGNEMLESATQISKILIASAEVVVLHAHISFQVASCLYIELTVFLPHCMLPSFLCCYCV